eukprot:1184821-Prorocentrum_minimum.AAC.1
MDRFQCLVPKFVVRFHFSNPLDASYLGCRFGASRCLLARWGSPGSQEGGRRGAGGGQEGVSTTIFEAATRSR